jgi:hypothetical protein
LAKNVSNQLYESVFAISAMLPPEDGEDVILSVGDQAISKQPHPYRK